MTAERRFVVFSDDWGRHPSSSQHLFTRIARRRRVVWVNTIGTRTPTRRACPTTIAEILDAAAKIERDEMRIDELIDGLIDPNAVEEEELAADEDAEIEAEEEGDEDDDGEDGGAAAFK